MPGLLMPTGIPTNGEVFEGRGGAMGTRVQLLSEAFREHSGNIWRHSGNIWTHSGNIWSFGPAPHVFAHSSAAYLG
jgi:hypothetical protein